MANIYPPLITALRDPDCYPHSVKRVSVLETHISWILLAGRFAYKIKKPVNLGFLDFSQLQQRAFFCREEVRLNRRLAPEIYLDTVSIGGNVERPRFNTEPAIEYAVKMRRFAAGKLLDTLLANHHLDGHLIDKLAETIAMFHLSLPPPPPDSAYGSSAAVYAPARQNFEQLSNLLRTDDALLTQGLHDKFEQEHAVCANLFEQRRQAGFVREGHGDLHLGNICLLHGQPVAFDGIEFSPDLRWIDVINDAGFVVMDLLHRDHPDLAYRFLNAYLQHTGDYAGLAVLRFYLSYRATVRAKIAAIRWSQTQAAAARQESLSYLALAAVCLQRRRPVLLLTHGLPGCGKSLVSQALLEKYALIRLRSDVERKRLFGLKVQQPSGSAIDAGIYTPQASLCTYGLLSDLARELLANGFAVVIDAAFLQYWQRQMFRQLARDMHAAFAILSIRASDEVLRQRIRQRQQRGGDASEADLTVLEKAITNQESLRADEQADTWELANESSEALGAVNLALPAELEQLLGEQLLH